jgi:dephospho-CoA kinase
MILVVSGLPAAGKTTFACQLEHLGIERIDVGQVLASWLSHDLPRAEIGPAFVRKFGREKISVALLKSIEERRHAVTLDAVRLAVTCQALQDFAGRDVRTVFIDAPEDLRRARLARRYENAGQSAERLMELQSMYDADILKVRALANAIVDNSRGVDDLKVAADSVWRGFVARTTPKR